VRSRRVLFVQQYVPNYRTPFLERVKVELESVNVDFRVILGQPVGAAASKRDAASPGEFIMRKNATFSLPGTGGPIVWQPILGLAKNADAIIVEQANRLLVNPLLLSWQRVGGPRVGFWGHGRNFQSRTRVGVAEAWKRLYSRWPDWWFTYTEDTSSLLESYGYSRDRITILYNTVDTAALAQAVAECAPADLSEFRTKHHLQPGRTALFMGSLYPDKSLDYAVVVAREVANRLAGFRLLVCGDGPSGAEARAAAEAHPDYISYLGRVDGADRVRVLASADVLLMPGLLGLVVLDAFAAGLPILTRKISWHSPEFSYMGLEHGLILPPSTSAPDFAAAAVRLMGDQSRMKLMREACLEASLKYPLTRMVSSFTSGIRSWCDS
jgi:glycosyltransferase involved in cell wall biosynthesis